MKINNVAHGNGKAVSAICSLGLDGIRTIRTVEETMNGDAFIQCLIEDIFPTMNRGYCYSNGGLIVIVGLCVHF